MDQKSGQRLKLYIVKCHVDKPLQVTIEPSKYEIPIQAGAALTDQRICDVNDHDNFSESISERNQRYSEATAMYWMYRHIGTESYIGIAHYRRRLKLSDIDLEQYMNDGVDIITTKCTNMKYSISEGHCRLNYAYDWKVFMDILEEREPDEFEFDRKVFDGNLFHAGSINVFRTELYKEYGDWCFPILNDFFERVPEKTDNYRRRDVGFIAESLSHLFVMKMIRDGKRVIEIPLIEYESEKWKYEEACNYENPDEVFNTCNSLYKQDKILQCAQVVSYYEANKYPPENRIHKLSQILFASQMERAELPQTMHDYLPKEFRSDINTLMYIWGALETAVKTHLIVNNSDSAAALKDFLELTHFSDIAVSVARKLVKDS